MKGNPKYVSFKTCKSIVDYSKGFAAGMAVSRMLCAVQGAINRAQIYAILAQKEKPKFAEGGIVVTSTTEKILAESSLVGKETFSNLSDAIKDSIRIDMECKK